MPNNEKNNHICDVDEKGIKFILFKMEIPVAVITSMEIYLNFIYFSKHTSVIATFYGMNIDLPSDINHPWTFLSQYTIMILVIIGSAVSTSIMA